MSEPGQQQSAPAMRGVVDAAARWLSRDGAVVTATVIDTWGSAPVPIGGQMVVATDGDFEGSVSGGCVEGEVIAAAEDVRQSGRPETLSFGVSDDTAWGVGLPCGGEVRVLVERVAAGTDEAGVVDAIREAQTRRNGLVVETDLETGAKRLFHAGDPNVPDDIAARFRTGKSGVVTRAEQKVFLQAVIPPARSIVIGATHIAQLFAQVARLAGYEVIIVDPRTAFATPERFPDVDVRAEWPQDVLPRIELDAYTALVVVAHVAHIDDEALKQALNSDCLYIGALGSSRNHAKRTERLTDAGFTEDQIARIKCPIGLDIGAQSPAEIAVAIMGEVILAVRGQKYGAGLTATHAEIAAA